MHALCPVLSLSANFSGSWMWWPLRTLSWTALTSCMHLTMTCWKIHFNQPKVAGTDVTLSGPWMSALCGAKFTRCA